MINVLYLNTNLASLFISFGFIVPKNFKLFGFPIFDFERTVKLNIRLTMFLLLYAIVYFHPDV